MTKNMRITDHPVLGRLKNRAEVTFTFNEYTYKGLKGDTIASALLANGVRKLRVQEESGSPRGIYCNIGHCFECRAIVNGVSGIRTCLTPIQEGMDIQSGQQAALPLDSEKQSTDELPRTYAEFVKMSSTNEAGDHDA